MPGYCGKPGIDSTKSKHFRYVLRFPRRGKYQYCKSTKYFSKLKTSGLHRGKSFDLILRQLPRLWPDLLRRPDSNRRPLGYEPNALPTAPLHDISTGFPASFKKTRHSTGKTLTNRKSMKKLDLKT